MKNIDKYLIFQILKIISLVALFIPFGFYYPSDIFINIITIAYNNLLAFHLFKWILPVLFTIITFLSLIYRNKKLDIAVVILFIFILNIIFGLDTDRTMIYNFSFELIYIITIWIISIAIKKGLEYFNNKKS